MGNTYDFSGWATRNDLLCGDGRTIRKDAFKNQDGVEVPLIWNHKHDDPDAVLGHAILENRDEGVYAYCRFNESDSGKQAKELVKHGDVRSLSIWANHLKQVGNDVIHGVIRELSLVLAGANPGAYIDFVMAHSEDGSDELYANWDEGTLILYHSDEEKNEKKGETEMAEQNKDAKEIKETKASEETKESGKTVKEVFETFTDEQKEVVYALIGQAVEEAKKESKDDEVKHSDTEGSDEKTVQDVIDSMSEEQKAVMYALVGQALESEDIADDDDDDENEEVKHSEGGEDFMKTNVFDQEMKNENVISHSEMQEILADAKRGGSLKEAVLSHGIEEIGLLYEDFHNLNNTPDFKKRDTTWVGDVMNAVHRTPFSRIKSVFADITGADARARGYFKKGTLKEEEVFTLLKRETTPTTVYKKQKLDRDDVVDITSFDVIGWLKMEMRMMLDEEIARAILVGDGRTPSSNDKINEQNIRPIWTDEDGYTIKASVNVTAETTDDEKAKAFIRATIKSRKDYKGSGNPVMFITEDMLTNCLLLEDNNGRVIYDSMEKLATALRVKKIVAVPVMENCTRTVGGNTHELAGIYVNLQDYNVGADKGGAVNLFDDFDIDYNQQKYLIETRISGALTKLFAAVAIEFVSPTA